MAPVASTGGGRSASVGDEGHALGQRYPAPASGTGLLYLFLDSEAGPARAEACDGCQAYLELLYVEQGPQLEPLADDVASLALDLLVGERGYQRLGQNPYLVAAEGSAEA